MGQRRLQERRPIFFLAALCPTLPPVSATKLTRSPLWIASISRTNRWARSFVTPSSSAVDSTEGKGVEIRVLAPIAETYTQGLASVNLSSAQFGLRAPIKDQQ